MGQARICDKCKSVLKYAPDTKIKIYVHPYGDMPYELCSKCTEKLKTWLNSENSFNIRDTIMEKNKVYAFEGHPVKILGENKEMCTALVLVRDDKQTKAEMRSLPIECLKPYKCPYAEDKDIKRVYCENGICQYPMPESAPFAALTGMCMRCLMRSFEEAENETNN